MRAAIAFAAALAVSACGASRTVAVAPATTASTANPVQRLQADLSAIFETPRFERSFWSVLVSSSDAGDDLYALNAAKLMMPGSTMKVVTLATAAELLAGIIGSRRESCLPLHLTTACCAAIS